MTPLPRKSRLPLGLIGMIVLVASVEAYLRSRSGDFTVDIAATWRWTNRSVSKEAGAAEILCFGDSLVKFGVVPRLIEEKVGRKTSNLAVFQGNPAATYLLLRRVLDSGARPAALVVDGELLPNDPLFLPGVWANLASPAEALQLAWAGKDANFFAAYALSKTFASIQTRHEVRARIMAKLNASPDHQSLLYALNWRNWQQNRGAFVVPSDFQTPDSALKHLETVSKAEAWAVHPTNQIYLDKLLNLTSARGIPVFWLFPPQHPAFVKHFDRPNYAEARDRYLREQIDKHANLTVIDGRHSGYDRPALSDLSHLNRRGACAFSLALGEVLKDRLAPGEHPSTRWVELPSFQEPGDLPVEDTNQSMIAVLKAINSRRR